MVKSCTVDRNLLQPTENVNSTPHTSHFSHVAPLFFLISHQHSIKNKVWRALHTWCHLHCVHVVCCLIFYDSLFYSRPFHLLSHLPFHSLRSSSSSMWWKRTLRTFANEDFGILAENDPPTQNGPTTLIICMIWNSTTTPSAWRSLHHCSSRIEKMQRAVDKLITLLTKVCRPVSRRLSVMLEQGDLLLFSLIHLSPTSEKIRVEAQRK